MPDVVESLARKLLIWHREHPETPTDDGAFALLAMLTPDERRVLLNFGAGDDRVPDAEVRRRLGLDR